MRLYDYHLLRDRPSHHLLEKIQKVDFQTLSLVQPPIFYILSQWQYFLQHTRLATYRGPSFNDSGLLDARKELLQLQRLNQSLANTVDSPALITRIDESIGQKMLRTAKWYLDTNNPIAAEYTTRRLIQKHENTAAAIEALEHLVPRIIPQLPPIIKDEVGEFYLVYQEALLGKILTSVDLQERKK